jgi:hypothetical protein
MSSAPKLGTYVGPSGGYPRPILTDPYGINTLALTGDVLAYQKADEDFNNRYPQLKKAQDQYMDSMSLSAGQAYNNLVRQNTMTNLGIDQLYKRMTSGAGSPVAGEVIGAGRSMLGNVGNESAITAAGTRLLSDASNENALTAAGQSLLGRDANLDALTGAYGAASGQALTRSQNPLSQNLRTLQAQAGQALAAAPDTAFTREKALGAANLTGADYQALQRKGMGLASGTAGLDNETQQLLARTGMMGSIASLGGANFGDRGAANASLARNLGISGEQLAQEREQRGLGLLQGATAQQQQAQSLLGQGQQGLLAQRQQALGEVGQSEQGNIAAQQAANQTLANYGGLYNAAINQQLARTQAGTATLSTAEQLGLSRQQAGAGLLGQAQQLGLARQQAGAGLLGAGQQLSEQYQQDTQGMLGNVQNMLNANNAAASQNITTASQLFTPRQFGIGGQGFAQIAAYNTGLENQFNVSRYNTAVQEAGLRANQQSQQAGANAQASNQNISTGVSIAAIGATAAAAGCAIAREVYGAEDPRWKTWRHWLVNKAPRLLRLLYLWAVPSVVTLLRRHPAFRPVLQTFMDPMLPCAKF